MKCEKILGRICDQRGCITPATCRTMISGFYVNACAKHHVCDNTVYSTKGLTVSDDSEPDCPCHRCVK